MLKFNLKKYAVVTVVAMTVSHAVVFSADDHAQTQSGGGEKPKAEFSPGVRQDGTPNVQQDKSPVVHQENNFSKYDTLRERLEHLSKIAHKEKKNPEVIHTEGQPAIVRITPSQAQFAEGAEILKRVKWYRERMKESCESSDKSSKMLGEFIDECLINGLVFDSVKLDADQSNKDQTTFELDARKIHACKTEMNGYFAAKKSKLGDAEWKKFAIDQEINDKLTKFFNWYGASAEGIIENSKEQAAHEPSELIKEVGMISPKNLCLIEEAKPQATPVQKPKYEPKKEEPKKEEPKKQAVQGPAEPSKQFAPPQVQNPAPQAPPPQQPAYQPPQQGYQGGKYDPSGLGYGGKYDPRDRKPYDYENIRNYGDQNYGSTPLYIPQMNNRGNNYIPPSNNSLPPRQAVAPVGGGVAPIGGVPFLGRGFSLGLGFSNAYGYPYGMYGMMPYGGYGGGYYPGYGGGGFYPGYGGGYVPVVPVAEVITPCGGLIGGCGGCGGGLLSPISSCGNLCGGGLMTPINSCGNNMLYNPINMYPGRMVMPRGPGGINYPYNPMYNYTGFNPNRTYFPRNPGNNSGGPLQIVPPVNGGTTNTTLPTTVPNITIPPYIPGYNSGNTTVPSTPIRITLPRTP